MAFVKFLSFHKFKVEFCNLKWFKMFKIINVTS